MPAAPRATFEFFRRAFAGAALAALLAGCGTPAPPPRLYQLPLDAPAAAASAAPRASGAVLEIAADVRLPAYLDRQTVVVARGDAGLELLEGHRWAEPLRDTVPRLLRHDLEKLLGAGRVWAAPAPERVPVSRRLRVEVLALQASADRQSVVLQARWTLHDPRGAGTPANGHADLRVATGGGSVDDVARGHRIALWRLAERIAAEV